MTGGRRLPRTLFGGRMRTSTALLAAAFVGVLLLWYAVRPDPAEYTDVVRVRTTREVVGEESAERRRPEAVVRPPAEVREPVVPTPTPTKTATPKPRRTPAATPAPVETPPAPGEPAPAPLLPGQEPAPAPTDPADPDAQESAPARSPGLFDGVPGARAPQFRGPSTAPSPTEGPADVEPFAAQR